MTDKNNISMSAGHSFSNDPLSINWVLLKYYELLNRMENIWDFLIKKD